MTLRIAVSDAVVGGRNQSSGRDYQALATSKPYPNGQPISYDPE
jgi:hypothetical protein